MCVVLAGIAFMFYLLTILIIFRFSSLFRFWLSLEFNIVILILLNILYRDADSDGLGFGIEYFLVQSLGSLVLLFSSVDRSFVLGEGWIWLLFLAILIKIGFFPFHTWFYRIVGNTRWVVFVLILTLHKIPLFLILCAVWSDLLLLLLGVRIVYGSLKLISRADLGSLLVRSSIYMGLWTLLFFSVSTFLGLFFTLCYMLVLLSFSYDFHTELALGRVPLMLPFYALVSFLVGLPPLPSFFIKYIAVISVWGMGRVFLVFLWVFTLISTIGYLKFLFNRLNFNFMGVYSGSDVSKTIFFFVFTFLGSILLF